MRIVCFLVLLIALLTCKSSEVNAHTSTPLQEKKANAWSYFTEFGGEETARNYVIQTQAEFDSVFQKIHENTNPKPELPLVDFDINSVGIIHFGTKKTGGSSFVYKNFHENELGGITIHIENHTTNSDVQTMVIIQPVLLFTLPKTNKLINTIVTSHL